MVDAAVAAADLPDLAAAVADPPDLATATADLPDPAMAVADPSNPVAAAPGDTNNFLPPLSLEEKQQVAKSSNDLQEESAKDTISGGFMSPSIAEDATESLRGHLKKPNEGKESESASYFMDGEENSTDGCSSEAMDTNKDEGKHSRHKNSSAWSNEVINRNTACSFGCGLS
ncbi:uncharacterized protein [Miscanthus floridulus]|uniref:uncharacterized protein n=1 Tax=Miscanthus floridulus TaxID=154761 RepID=UPI00345ACD3D